MKGVTFILPARDKERYVGHTVATVLAQTEACTIYLSDQGSRDGTRAILVQAAQKHGTHHRVHVLDCPNTEPTGMPGLNAHLNWLNEQIDGDVIIMCSADDLNHPDRVKHTVRAFEEQNPSYVNTGVQYINEAGVSSFTSFPNKATRWLDPVEVIRHQIGSCGSSAWARDLYTPLVGFEQQDMILPHLALMERGIYYVDLPLHTYVMRPSLENTGFQGQIAASTSEEHKAQLIERNNFVHVRNWTMIFRRLREHPNWIKLTEIEGFLNSLMQKITETGYAWAYAREALINSGIKPL